MSGFVLMLVAAYLIGAIPCGLVLARLMGLGDIRQAGSGNIGATNVYRVGGRGLGVATLVLDALKGLLPVLAAMQLFPDSPWKQSLVAAAAFLGHCYPVYLGFKGGKGVATGLGIYLMLSPLAVLIALGVFAGVLWKWRYVSLASICAAGIIPLLVAFERSLPLFLVTLFISGMVIWRHRGNIERLLSGTENRFRA